MTANSENSLLVKQIKHLEIQIEGLNTEIENLDEPYVVYMYKKTGIEKQIWNLKIEIEGLKNDLYDQTIGLPRRAFSTAYMDAAKIQSRLDEPCQDYVEREFGFLVGGKIKRLLCSKHYRGEKGTNRIDQYVGFQILTKNNGVKKTVNIWIYSDESGRGPGVLHIEQDGIEY